MLHRKNNFAFLALVTVLLLTASLLNADAYSSNTPTPLEIINKYSIDETIHFSISNTKSLYSLSGDHTYTLYELCPYGYAILLDETNSLMEACYSENSSTPVNMDANTTYYYGGPGVYCVLQDNSFYNIFDDTYLTIDDYQSLSASEICAYNYEINSASIISNNTATTFASSKSSSTAKIHSVGYNYFSTLTQYGENANGTCTVIAISILLGYYDNYNNDAIIASKYEDGNGTTEEFHQLLNNYVYGSSTQGGIFIHNAAPGINKYFTANNLDCTLESEYSSQTTMINLAITQLQSGNPVVASMGTSYDAPYNHTVLVYQVQYDSTSPSSTAVFTIHMGWHQDTAGNQSATEYLASAGWFYECGYIQNNCVTHSLSGWKDYDIYYHCNHCVNCTYIELESHSPYWNSILGKCSRCKRTGTIGDVFG